MANQNNDSMFKLLVQVMGDRLTNKNFSEKEFDIDIPESALNQLVTVDLIDIYSQLPIYSQFYSFENTFIKIKMDLSIIFITYDSYTNMIINEDTTYEDWLRSQYLINSQCINLYIDIFNLIDRFILNLELDYIDNERILFIYRKIIEYIDSLID